MSAEDLAKLYCAFLEEVKTRLSLVRSITERALTAGAEIFDYEVVAVNLRKILELIAFGALSANKDVYAQAHAEFAQHWSATRLLKNLEKLHPDFYPKPILPPKVLQEGPPRHLHFDFVSDGFLTRDGFIELYSLCSQVIHTRNPFSQDAAIDFRQAIPQWTSRIELLLRLHLMRLAGTPQIWIAELSATADNRAHAHIAFPEGFTRS